MPPSITAGGTGAALMLSHGRQAYCGRLCQWTKDLARIRSSCSLMSSPILTSAALHSAAWN